MRQFIFTDCHRLLNSLLLLRIAVVVLLPAVTNNLASIRRCTIVKDVIEIVLQNRNSVLRLLLPMSYQHVHLGLSGGGSTAILGSRSSLLTNKMAHKVVRFTPTVVR